MPDSAQFLNYHTGLFLEVGEFNVEQNYHRRLRRTINYGLLTSGILYGLNVEYDGTSSRVRVRKGIAVNNDAAAMIAQEIILAADYDVPLTGITTGQAYIVLSYDTPRDGAVKPTSPPGNPATKYEVAKVDAVPGASFSPDPDAKIVLARITIGTPLTTNPARQMAQVRTDLLPAVATPPGITLFPLSVDAGTTAVLILTATGSFNLTGITASAVNISGAGISNVAVAINTGVQMQITFDIAAGTASGSRTVTVTKSGVSVSAAFYIAQGLTLTAFNGVNVPAGITYVRLTGTGFSAPATIEFSLVAGFSAPVLVPTGNVMATEIRVEMTSIPPDAVRGPVRVTVSGRSVTSAFNFVPPPRFTPGTTFDHNPFSRSTHGILGISGNRFYAPVNVRFKPYTDLASRLAGTAPGSFPDTSLGESFNETNIQVVPPAAAQSNGSVRIETPGGIVDTTDILTITS